MENCHAGLIKTFQEIWLLRARKGGLHEAVDLLEKAVKQTIKLSGSPL